jgi:hypothetical protein
VRMEVWRWLGKPSDRAVQLQNKSMRTIDNRPRVWHSGIVVLGKRMVADPARMTVARGRVACCRDHGNGEQAAAMAPMFVPGGAKSIAPHGHTGERLRNIIRGKVGKGATQAVPYVQHCHSAIELFT